MKKRGVVEERDIDASSLGYLKRTGGGLSMACNNVHCMVTLDMDLDKMIARFGERQSILEEDLRLVYPFHCKWCGSMDWRVVIQSGEAMRVSENLKMTQALKEKKRKEEEK